MPDLDAYLVRHALTVAREHGYAEVEIGAEGATFAAVLEPRKSAPKAAKDQGAVDTEPEPKFIRATLVGYLQSLSLKEDDELTPGQIVAVVTALGIANDIESPIGGTVVEVMAKEGQAVEYGQPLARVM